MKDAYGKRLGECLSRADRALGDSSRSIHRICPILEYTMEMHARCFVSQLVGKMYSDRFTNVGPNRWNGPLIIDANDRSFMQTVGILVYPSNVPVIDSSKYTYAMRQDNEEK